MTSCVVIPTFWTRRRGRFTDRLINVYDHPTPVDGESPLGDCLRSLERVTGLGKVVVLVAATDASIEHEAEDRVREIVDEVPGIDAMVFGPAELGSLHRRLEQLEFGDMVAGVSLTGYGAVRNVGLVVAATLGAEHCFFVDDDEVITDPDFLTIGAEGLGHEDARRQGRATRRPATTWTRRAGTISSRRPTGRTRSGGRPTSSTGRWAWSTRRRA